MSEMMETAQEKRGESGVTAGGLGRIGQISGPAILLLLGIVGALAMGELTMRLAFSKSMDFDMEMWKYATQIKIASDEPDTGHEHRPNREAFLMGTEVATNSFGLRDDEISLAKPNDTYRIVVLGDSITFGWGVSQDKAYVTQLERLFTERPPEGLPSDKKYETLNLGVGNYNTVQEVSRLQRIGLKFNPDLIVLGYFINDAEPTPAPRRGFLIENSYIYAFVASRMRGLNFEMADTRNYEDYYRALYKENKLGWERAQDALGELAEIGREQEIPVLVAIIPELHDLSASYPFSDIHATLKDLCKALGLPVVDLLPQFAGFSPESDLQVSPADAHHNELAQAMIAQGIYDAIDAGALGQRGSPSQSKQ